jgi:hypothetical protein
MQAQRFVVPTEDFSYKKTSYITLDNGKEIQCTLKRLKLEKGLVEEIKIEDLNDEKIKIKPEEIKHMYLPPSGLEKLNKKIDFITDATLWDADDINGDLVGEGYAYFEKSKVRIKKDTEVLLLQLLNPQFSNKIKVYHDPYAKETASIGVGDMNLAGGDAKSYYVKKGDVAVLLKKKDYEEEFAMYYKDCPKLVKQYKDNVSWSDFVNHVHMYATECEK